MLYLEKVFLVHIDLDLCKLSCLSNFMMPGLMHPELHVVLCFEEYSYRCNRTVSGSIQIIFAFAFGKKKNVIAVAFNLLSR